MFSIAFTTSALDDIRWFRKREQETIFDEIEDQLVFQRENLVLRTEDGREFLLAELDHFDREVELTRQNEELMRLLDERGREKATLSSAEARAQLGIG
jgi:hypothetical protein